MSLTDNLVSYAGKINDCANVYDYKGMWYYYGQLEMIGKILNDAGKDIEINASHIGEGIEITGISVNGETVFEKKKPEHMLDKIARTTNKNQVVKAIMDAYDRSVITGERCSLYLDPDDGRLYMVDGNDVPETARSAHDVKMCSYQAKASASKREHERKTVEKRMELVYEQLQGKKKNVRPGGLGR